jgi:hypothetical protein
LFRVWVRGVRVKVRVRGLGLGGRT